MAAAAAAQAAAVGEPCHLAQSPLQRLSLEPQEARLLAALPQAGSVLAAALPWRLAAMPLGRRQRAEFAQPGAGKTAVPLTPLAAGTAQAQLMAGLQRLAAAAAEVQLLQAAAVVGQLAAEQLVAADPAAAQPRQARFALQLQAPPTPQEQQPAAPACRWRGRPPHAEPQPQAASRLPPPCRPAAAAGA